MGRLALLSGFCLLGWASIATAQAQAQTKTQRIVEPLSDLHDVQPVAAQKTPSGFPIPRYVSLKFGEVNGRTGPSLDHPIAWQYRQRGLPLIVVAETELWRKVRDIYGDESWVRKPALSGERGVITLSVTNLHRKPDAETRIMAIAPKDTLLKLESCEENGWCKVKAESGEKGWAPRHSLWGAVPLS